MYVIFDENKKFISYSSHTMGKPFYCKEIEINQEDLMNWRWDGDYENGNLVKIEDAPYQSYNHKNFFEDRYSFDLFMSILIKQLFITAKQTKTAELPFEEMVKDYVTCLDGEEIYLELLKIANKKL
jgi:hypothetical protein